MSNVLVYSGPGVSISALQHTLRTLRQLLTSYDVQSITAKSLALDPWDGSTSLVVIPGGRDLPYVDQLGQPYPVVGSSVSGIRQLRADERIRSYVENGGAFLGICAGAYYASSHCSFEKGTSMEVDGPRPALQFYPGTCQGAVFPGFVYESDAGARLVQLHRSHGDVDGEEGRGDSHWRCHYNGGGAFIDADSYADAGVTILARYPSLNEVGKVTHDTYAEQAAAVRCRRGKGNALLYGVHPEFPILPESRPVRLTGAEQTLPETSRDGSGDDKLRADDALRLREMGLHLRALGLTVDLPNLKEESQAEGSKSDTKAALASGRPPMLTPLVLVASDPTATWSILDSLRSIKTPVPLRTFEELATLGTSSVLLRTGDSNDHFHFFTGDDYTSATVAKVCATANYGPFSITAPPSNIIDDTEADAIPEPEVDLHLVPKCVLVYPPTRPLPENVAGSTFPDVRTLTPHFDTELYLTTLAASRRLLAHSAPLHAAVGSLRFASPDRQVIGDPVLYAQMVTSTQTMLDRNFKVLSRMPSGLTAFATHQASGRGRGGNTWISPLGCLQFSTILRLPASLAPRVVFVQYLAGLAIVEAVRSALGPEYRTIGERIRIKWPNDVYAEVGDDDKSTEECKGTFVMKGKRYAKMAGVLVNSQFAGQEFVLVVGCGINCTNARPTTSLSDLISSHNAKAASEGSPPVAPVSQERLGGAVLATFEKMWNVFVEAGRFEPFVENYAKVWLHSDQNVTLHDTDPPSDVRIVGIASDYGTLRAVRATSNINSYSPSSWGASGASPGRPATLSEHGDFVDLQPDGNSFDMLQNLIRRK